ncbi:MAG TPA: IS1634 family transposase [Steroidobacteraceae bacterium]|nr:IS1634 family transposase [Steroidobacteraceae bacterium]
MFLRATTRKKDGKEHRYFSVVENKRVRDGRVVQRHVLYLGEINSSQEFAWRKSIEVLDEAHEKPRTLALFPEDRCEGVIADESTVRLRLSQMRLERPRQWGGCWLALQLWRELALDEFWRAHLAPSRKGTRWDEVLLILVVYRLLCPGSEWRLHREWYGRSALADLLGMERVIDEHALYECHDRLLEHKTALFDHLVGRWRDLFNVSFDVLLYDLTSTYFEIDPPLSDEDKRQFGYSRDKRPDCVQVVIALIVTPQGFPLAYEVLAGNTADNTTLKGFLARIERQYGKARRCWCMDRGVPTEAVLEQMRASDPPVQYVVGTPKGRLTALQRALLTKPWAQARADVRVKLLAQDQELYVFAESRDRIAKERGMRRRQLKWLWQRLKQLSTMPKLTREALLMKLGAAQSKAPAAWRLVTVEMAVQGACFGYWLNRKKLREVRRREGRYLLRTNLTESDPAKLWEYYIQLVAVEEAFKTLKGDLSIRPIFHQREKRIEAHIFIAFLAYCLHVTLGHRLKHLASGLTARSVLEKFSAVQMIDVHIPTTDGRELMLTRYTQPEAELKLLLERLKVVLPPQPPPKITPTQAARPTSV